MTSAPTNPIMKGIIDKSTKVIEVQTISHIRAVMMNTIAIPPLIVARNNEKSTEKKYNII